jgi:hypothetical protein
MTMIKEFYKIGTKVFMISTALGGLKKYGWIAKRERVFSIMGN